MLEETIRGGTLTSLYSWIWLCSNMEKTLEEPPSPAACLLLAFLGACGGNRELSLLDELRSWARRHSSSSSFKPL